MLRELQNRDDHSGGQTAILENPRQSELHSWRLDWWTLPRLPGYACCQPESPHHARRCTMSLRPEPLPPIPDVTAAAVRAAFPKGNLYVDLRAEFGTLYTDQLFADLYPPEGRPVEVAPWRLALVVVMQYMEGLTDRQAADAVRRCMDWKYVLSLDLTDPGFDFTLLHDFRHRLLAHDATQRFLDTFLAACKARGWIKARGHATDRFHPCLGGDPHVAPLGVRPGSHAWALNQL